MATAIGVFDHSQAAERAIEELQHQGFDQAHIGVVHDERVVHGYRTTRAVVTGNRQLAAGDAGGVLVSVLADDDRVALAEQILDAAGAASVETRDGEWSQWGAAESIHDSEPAEPLREADEPEPDPLVDLETNKGGT